jgi:hypothetical protein
MERNSPEWAAYVREVGCSEEEAWGYELRRQAAQRAQLRMEEADAPRRDAMAAMHVLKSVRDAAKKRIAARVAKAAQ